MRAAAGILKLELRPIEVSGVNDFEGAFSTWSRDQAGGCVIGDHAMLTYNTGAIATIAANQRLPSVGQLQLPASGGLIGYGVNFTDFFRPAAYFVDQILKGSRPGDFRSNRPPNSRRSLISGLPRLSASMFQRQFCYAQTR